MNSVKIARQLRRQQTDEEKQLWRALRSGRFAGFKFRRQHPLEHYILDFYCPIARLSVELDGFQHGLPAGMQRDLDRKHFMEEHGIQELRFWNHQWRKNREGVLLEIWAALYKRTGCLKIARDEASLRYVPPSPEKIILRAENGAEKLPGDEGEHL